MLPTYRLVACAALFLGLIFNFSSVSCAQSGNTFGAIKLISVAPEGDNVEPPSQIVLQFSAPVVALGRMERSSQDIAITINPRLPCQWRWMNTSALMCVLDSKDLPKKATRYEMTIPKTFDKIRGEVLDRDYTTSFVTQRPAVTSSWFKIWSSPGRPLLEVLTNQEIDAEMLRSHLILEDSSRRSYPFTLEPSPKIAEEGVSAQVPEFDELRWILAPKDELPLDTAMTLRATPGLRAKAGGEASLEDRRLLEFHTFPAFEFLGVGCFDTKGEAVDILVTASPSQRKKKLHACDPLNAISLLFNSPVMVDQAKGGLQISPDLTGGRSDVDPWQAATSYSQLQWGHSKGQRYGVYLPYGLRANATYSVQGSATGIRDEFGRTLARDFSASFTTGHRSPRYVLDNQVSVLEKEVDSKLPLIVNNIDSVKLSYQAVSATSNVSGLTKTITPYNVPDVAYAHPIDIREMLGGRSGVVQGTLSTIPKTSEEKKWFFSQVTPFSVHVKFGHFSSLVWVTSFATGQPISNAKVAIGLNNMSSLATSQNQIATATTDENGIARLPGSKSIDPTLAAIDEWDHQRTRLFVHVERDGEVAFVPLSWEFQAFSENHYAMSTKEYGHVHAWGTTAQGIYKAGDTVQFALWVRDQNDTTFTSAPSGPYTLEVTDPAGKVVYTVPGITLSEFGSYAGSFTTAKEAAVGWYSFSITATYGGQRWEPFGVLISDFTPAPFKVTSRIASSAVHPGDTLKIDTEARLHAGGPYSDAATRVTAILKSQTFESSDTRLGAFSFDGSLAHDEQLYQKEDKVNAQGDLSSVFTVSASEVPYGRILVESAVRDDRGKFVSSISTATFIGRDRYVGVAQPDWLLTTGKEAEVQAVVVDGGGTTVAGAPFTVLIEHQTTKAVRVKSAGNVYVTKYENEWTKVRECSLTSTRDPISCAFTPPGSGSYRISAKVRDEKGREHMSTLTRWATGSDTVLWNTGVSTELQIIPEKKSYKIGEMARFLIQNPYPGARALLTTERYGVQSSWIRVLQNSSEVVELPITKDHLPAVYLSATVISPRVEKPVEGTVDLGKPSFRMGYSKVEVVDPVKQLVVDVSSSKEVYRPRETVTLSVGAKDRDGSVPPMEYAVSVLDEAVFDMISAREGYFDPYKGFYKLDTLDVRNYNLIRMLVGQQKFEKKGANAGGDGGKPLDMRTIRQYVSYWNPSIRPDAEGKATFSFEAPDNLTGWKVLVMAFTKDDRMGLGTDVFKVNKMTEVRPALPNQVRRGDSFTGTFTVMNRSEVSRKIVIEARVSGAASAAPLRISMDAEPFKRYPILIEAKAEQEGLATFSVTAGDDSDKDSMKESVPVLPRAALQTVATFGSSDGAEASEQVEIPADIEPSVGSVGVVLSSTLLGNLEGAFAYMRDYPYTCWEQKITKAVMAANSIALKRYLPPRFEWKGADEVVRTTLSSLPTYQAPNGGMTFFQASDDYVSQYLSAYTAIALGWLKEMGYAVPVESERKLRAYLAGVLKNEEFPTSFTSSAKASLRGVILSALSQGGQGSREDILRFARVVDEMNLFGKAHYLQASALLPNTSALQSSTLKKILSSATQSGGTLSFREGSEGLSLYALDSPMRSSCALLESFVQIANGSDKALAERVKPIIPKLVRSITLDRARKDRWENTQENVFCVTALTHYSQAFEQTSPNLSLSVRLGATELGRTELSGERTEPRELSRPLTPKDAGASSTMTVSPSGMGRFYYSARISYASKDIKEKATNAGFELTREYSVERNGVWTLLRTPMAIKQGELVKVDLFLRTSAPRSFVVVEDPVPGGVEPVNRALATASIVDESKAGIVAPQGSVRHDVKEWIEFGASYWSFYHRELRNSSVRFYAEYLAAGNYHLSYVSQVVAPGDFVMLPAHAEEMYDPDVFGDSASGTMKVAAAQ